MALNQFYFTGVTDAEFAGASRIITLVGDHLKRQLRQDEYGKGVAWVIIHFFLEESRRSEQMGCKPTYESGTRTVGFEGAEFDVENALRIFITPDIVSVRSANSVGEIVTCVKEALLDEKKELLALSVPNFDMHRFFSDVIAQLDVIIDTPTLWRSLGGIGDFASGAIDNPNDKHLPSIEDFPAAVLALVEREMPFVNEAAQRKDRKAIMPLIDRLNEFMDQWADRMGPNGEIFDAFPDCAHLIADLGREVAIECDTHLPDAERERLHRDFQRRLTACKECAAGLRKKLEMN